MSGIYQEFARRANRIPYLGLGLSVDVYSPNVFELCEELQNRQLQIAYLEIFHAAAEALEIVRARLPDIPLAYHAEGLWVTQPDWETAYASQERLHAAARDLQILQAHWINHECASKEILGFAFGTYLPPLFTETSAESTAYHAWKAQVKFDQYDWWGGTEAPLMLLEGPPLSFFAIGDISYAEFFRRVTDMAPCGLVLDLGHVWTVYRYTGAWRSQSLESFFESFLKVFPLERVIQIHIAGLDCHPQTLNRPGSGVHRNLPAWIDAHETSIPKELFVLLGQVLREPRLVNLKGIALEVDNKQIPLICQEVKTVMGIVEPLVNRRTSASVPDLDLNEKWRHVCDIEPSWETRDSLIRQYQDYIELVTRQVRCRHNISKEVKAGMNDELYEYVTQYLPYEIISWGGDVREMFPQTCQMLKQHGLSLDKFVEFWFAHSRASETKYDFFLLKIHRFVEFLGHLLPCAGSTVKQEAELLTQGYTLACLNAQAL